MEKGKSRAKTLASSVHGSDSLVQKALQAFGLLGNLFGFPHVPSKGTIDYLTQCSFCRFLVAGSTLQGPACSGSRRRAGSVPADENKSPAINNPSVLERFFNSVVVAHLQSLQHSPILCFPLFRVVHPQQCPAQCFVGRPGQTQESSVLFCKSTSAHAVKAGRCYMQHLWACFASPPHMSMIRSSGQVRNLIFDSVSQLAHGTRKYRDPLIP